MTNNLSNKFLAVTLCSVVTQLTYVVVIFSCSVDQSIKNWLEIGGLAVQKLLKCTENKCKIESAEVLKA